MPHSCACVAGKFDLHQKWGDLLTAGTILAFVFSYLILNFETNKTFLFYESLKIILNQIFVFS